MGGGRAASIAAISGARQRAAPRQIRLDDPGVRATLSRMWIVEKYVKYLIGFVILWGLLAAYRTCGCAKVQGAHMQPTLISDQFVPVLAGKNKPGEVKQGDVVWFWFKLPNSREDGYLARVIGMPGDRVAIRAGNITLNGQALNEGYEKPETMNAS